jgi:hypothetical protein
MIQEDLGAVVWPRPKSKSCAFEDVVHTLCYSLENTVSARDATSGCRTDPGPTCTTVDVLAENKYALPTRSYLASSMSVVAVIVWTTGIYLTSRTRCLNDLYG